MKKFSYPAIKGERTKVEKNDWFCKNMNLLNLQKLIKFIISFKDKNTAIQIKKYIIGN